MVLYEALHDKIKIIASTYNLKLRIIIILKPIIWNLLFSFIRPFEFVTEKLPFPFLNEINLLTVIGAPEIKGPVNVLIGALFYSFHHKEVFPQDAGIVPDIKGIKLGNDGIPDAVIKEIVFCLAHYLLTQVSAESSDTSDNKSLSLRLYALFIMT